MMGVLGDLHIGVKNGDSNFLKFQTAWLDVKLTEMKKKGVTTIIQAGDFFDIRKSTPNNIIHWCINTFIPMVEKYGFEWHIIVGNHDIYYKHSNEINTVELLSKLSPLIHTYSTITETTIDDELFLMIPWLDKDNSENLDSKLKSTKAKYAIGHLEINGAPMYKGSICEGGLNANVFKQFDLVLSGHFHTISKHQNIQYLGSPYHLTWMDFVDGANRGWYSFDKGKLELHQNSEYETLFSFIEYDESIKYDEDMLSPYKGTILKVVVKEKTNTTKFNKFRSLLNSLGLIDYHIIDMTVIEIEQKSIVESDISEVGTLNYMIEYIEKNDIQHKEEVKEFAMELYKEVS